MTKGHQLATMTTIEVTPQDWEDATEPASERAELAVEWLDELTGATGATEQAAEEEGQGRNPLAADPAPARVADARDAFYAALIANLAEKSPKFTTHTDIAILEILALEVVSFYRLETGDATDADNFPSLSALRDSLPANFPRHKMAKVLTLLQDPVTAKGYKRLGGRSARDARLVWTCPLRRAPACPPVATCLCSPVAGGGPCVCSRIGRRVGLDSQPTACMLVIVEFGPN